MVDCTKKNDVAKEINKVNMAAAVINVPTNLIWVWGGTVCNCYSKLRAALTDSPQVPIHDPISTFACSGALGLGHTNLGEQRIWLTERYKDCILERSPNLKNQVVIVSSDPVDARVAPAMKECILKDEFSCNMISNVMVTLGLVTTMSMNIGAAGSALDYEDC